MPRQTLRSSQAATPEQQQQKLWSGAVVVMDNLPAHKVQGVTKIIEDAGASVVYLSPYSPEFNPI